MTTGTDLHDLLTAEAGGPTSGGPGWDDIVRRGRRRQRVQRAQRGALAALAIGAALTGVALSGDDPDLETTPPATDGITSTTLDYETTTTSTVPVGPAEPGFTAARVQGAFVTVIQKPFDPETQTDPCTSTHPRVAESATEVVVELVDASISSGQPWAACQSSSFSGWGTIELTDPLGDRRLVDAATGEAVPVVDGAPLLFPTELPAPFDIEAWDEFSPGTSWVFSWTAGDLFVNVTTGYAAGLDCDRQPVEVRGTTGEACVSDVGLVGLSWMEGGRRISIEMGAVDPGEDAGFTVDDAIAVAEGLEPLGG